MVAGGFDSRHRRVDEETRDNLRRAQGALRDLFRRRYWRHTGGIASSPEGMEYADPPSRFWTFKRSEWDPPHRWMPFIGGEEWCRWTLVLPIPFGGYLVTALWACRDPACEGEDWCERR